jgi:hypothetical protein
MRPALVPFPPVGGAGFPNRKVRSLCERPPNNSPGLAFVDPAADELSTFYDAFHAVPICGWVPDGNYAGYTDNFTGPYGRHQNGGHRYKSWTDSGGYANEINPDSLFRISKFDYGPDGYEKWELSCNGVTCDTDYTDTFPGAHPPSEDLIGVSFEGDEIIPDWRIIHEPPPSGYLKLWILHSSYSVIADDFIREILDPYEWDGASPQIVDFAKPIGIGTPLYPAWNSATAYEIGARVSWGGGGNFYQYEATADSTNQEPQDHPESWTVIFDQFPSAPINVVISDPVSFTRRGIPNSEGARDNQLSVLKYSFVKGYDPIPDDPDADPWDTGYRNGYPPPDDEWH